MERFQTGARQKTGLPKRSQPVRYSPENPLLNLTDGAVRAYMIESGLLANNDGTEYGRYGRSKYGRCKYSPGPRGIYGTAKYGSSRYSDVKGQHDLAVRATTWARILAPYLRLASRAQYGLGNYLEVEDDGTLKMVGDATVWEDLRTPASALKVPASNPAQSTLWKGSQVLAFEDQAVNYQHIYFIWQMPHSWKLGSLVYPHIHTAPEDATAGNVFWQFTYSVASKGQAFGTELSHYVTHAMPEVADEHQYEELGPIDMSGHAGLSTVILCGLHRRSDDARDTFAGKDVYLLEVDLHFEMDTIGSREEESK